jgi:PIN domain nuclease of toxin-antitoxin system
VSSSIVADTHTIIWHLYDSDELSTNAKQIIEDTSVSGNQLLIASITIVEMTYLIDKKRIKPDVLDKLYEALDDPASNIDIVYLTTEVAQTVKAVPRDLVPDMPDRIIAATALHLNLPLVTRDAKLQNFSQLTTIW